MGTKDKSKTSDAAKKKPSIFGIFAMFIAITLVAGGAGFGVSKFLGTPLVNETAQPAAKKSDDKETDTVSERDDETEAQRHGVELAPILTNLAAPKTVWVRLELALIGTSPVSQELADSIHQDLFSFIRTLKLQHIEGPSGYHNLKSELTLRARQRSEGAVERVLVRTLLLE